MAGADDTVDAVDSMQAEWSRHLPDLDFGSLGVVHRILRAARLILERSDAHLARYGLSRGELDILSALYRSTRPLTPTELAETLLATPPSVTMRLQALQRRGLLRREPSSTDRRSLPAHLTPAGVALVEEVIPAQLQFETELVSHLDASDQRHLANLLRPLTATWEAERPPPNKRTPSASGG